MDDTKSPENRDATGRFVPGHGPTGGGRKRMRDDVREMLEAATPHAAKRLIEALDADRVFVVGKGDDAHEVVAIDYGIRIHAAETIFSRIYGKPPQAITNEDGSPLMSGGKELLEALTSLAEKK